DFQKRQYVPKLATGELLGAWALTEPQAGSDTLALESTATQLGDRWELTGHKMFITQGRRADILVVMAKSGMTSEGRKEISAFIVHGEHRQVIRKIPTSGVRASDTAEIRFDKAPAQLIGQR